MANSTSIWLPDRQERKHRRYCLEYPVRMKFEDGGSAGELETISQNVSIGGFLVRSASVIPLHTPITFLISVHAEHGVRPIHLVGEGKIVRVERNEGDATFSIAVQCKVPVTQLEQHLSQ